MDFYGYEPDYESLILDRQEFLEALEDAPESEYVVSHPLYGLLDIVEN